MRHTSCSFIIVFLVASFFILISAEHLAAQSAPGAEEGPKPLIGETLLKTQLELQQTRDKLQQELDKANQEISRINGEKSEIATFFDRIPYLRILLSRISIAGVLVCCLWAALLIFMYGKVEKEKYAGQKGLIKKLLIIFLAFGFIFIVCTIASAESTGTPFPKRDLHTTLEYARTLPSL